MAAEFQPPPRGVALIMVLFILVLLTTFAAYMIEEQHIALRRITNQAEAEQGYQMAVASEQWAVTVLERDLDQGNTDSLSEDWRALGPPVTVEGGKLDTRVRDEQGKFNLNNLANKNSSWPILFRNLLGALGIDPVLESALIDWIDGDDMPRGAAGAEDNFYLLRNPPYRVANQPLADLDELLLIKGFDAKIVATLAPYVTVLPADNVPIDVNTASPMVLSALSENGPLDLQIAQTLVEARGEKGYPAARDFAGQYNALTARSLDNFAIEPYVTVQSEFFSVSSVARFGRITLHMTSLLQRLLPQKVVRVIARRRSLS